MKIINSCRLCSSKRLKKFLDLGMQPLANSLLKKPGQTEKKYPLSLSFCLDCRLVQLNQTIDPKVLFKNYLWVSGTSETTRKYAEEFYKDIAKRINGKWLILEIASNDGTFLKVFNKHGHLVLGIDPAENIADIAAKNGIPTIPEFFNYNFARKMKEKYKVVITRNVFYHVADIHSFTKGLSFVLADDGLLVLEIHYAKKILEELQYDSIYHEHLFYYSVRTLAKLLTMYGLYIDDIKTSPINSGNIVVYIKKHPVNSAILEKYLEEEKKTRVNQLITWSHFAGKVKHHRELFLNALEKMKGRIIGYGVSAKSATLLNYCGITADDIQRLIDDNPLKQGMYSPGSHIPIVSSDFIMKMPEEIIVLSSSFKKEIIEKMRKKYHYKGKFMIPFPKPHYE